MVYWTGDLTKVSWSYTPLYAAYDRQDMATIAAAASLQSCPTLCDPIDSSPPRLPRPWDSPGKNTGVGGHGISLP